MEGEVCPFEGSTEGRRALRVSGRLENQRRKGAIVIVANSKTERDDWVIALRVRIAPWQALARRVREVVRGEGPHSGVVHDICRTIFDQLAPQQPLTTGSVGDVGATSHDETSAVASATVEGGETFGRASIVPELVGTVATIVKVAGKVAGDKAAVETAQSVADIAKCVSIVGSLLQAVVITARCIRMVLEASRGRACLPGLHSELIDLLNCTRECAMVVVDPEVVIEDLRMNRVFRIQEECVLTLGND